MELKEMTIEALIEKRDALVNELDNEGADLDAIESEVRAIKEELESRKAAETKRNEVRSLVAGGEGTVVKTVEKEERKKMDAMEIRASKEYVEAYANYIKTKDDSECRSLLSENATNGTVAVPTLVYDLVKNAWEKDGIVSRVKKAYLQGNLKVNFEISSDGAATHNEGAAVNEEALVLGTVEIIPQLILKWVSISKEASNLRGEAFLTYVVDEIVQKIAKKAADMLVAQIDACGTQATTTCVGVPVVTSTTVSIGLIAEAMAKLSDQATNPVVIMNKATWGEFKKVQANNKYAYDVFEGLDVVFNNTIKSFTAASSGDTYAIVGDLGEGALMNFPNGEDIEVIADNISLATSGMVKYIGSEFVGIGVVGPDAFAKIVK